MYAKITDMSSLEKYSITQIALSDISDAIVQVQVQHNEEGPFAIGYADGVYVDGSGVCKVEGSTYVNHGERGYTVEFPSIRMHPTSVGTFIAAAELDYRMRTSIDVKSIIAPTKELPFTYAAQEFFPKQCVECPTLVGLIEDGVISIDNPSEAAVRRAVADTLSSDYLTDETSCNGPVETKEQGEEGLEDWTWCARALARDTAGQ